MADADKDLLRLMKIVADRAVRRGEVFVPRGGRASIPRDANVSAFQGDGRRRPLATRLALRMLELFKRRDRLTMGTDTVCIVAARMMTQTLR